MTRTFLLTFVISLSLQLQAQNPITLESIKNDTSYFYGEGHGDTDKDADQYALANLISQISVDVAADFELNLTELKQGDNIDSQSKVESIIKTYSANRLRHAHQLFVSHEPEAYVIRYIKESELSTIFKEREERIMDFVREAQEATEKVRIDDALRFYYWAFCLLKSLPEYTNVKYQGHLLINWIPQQMRDIFRDLAVTVAGREENEVKLNFTFRTKAVTSLDFRFMNGLNYSPITSVKGGIAQIEFRPGADFDKIQIRYEYEFEGQDKEVNMVTNAFRGTPFREATAFVGTDKKKTQKQALALFQQQIKTGSDAINTLELHKAKDYLSIMTDIIKAIRTKSYAKVRTHFTFEGYNMFNELIQYGQASIVGEPIMSFYQFNNKVICRSVPMQFAFKNNTRTFMENVTFTFDPNKKIESIAFALDQAARKDIFTKDVWPDSIRMTIATFIENYQTAFALKRLDYIESIFSDDALIITGHVVKPTVRTIENSKYISNEYVKYTRQNKRQYLKNLQSCFKSNEFINLRLTDNEVVKLGKEHGECYGILIHQDYYSSSYSDTGYLCLLVDFNEAKKPTIVVRTWQPQRDPNITPKLPRDSKHWGLLTPYRL